MTKSSRPKIHVCLGLFCLLLQVLSIGESSAATEEFNSEALVSATSDEVIANDGTIEVLYEAEAFAPYRERRGRWSGLFGVTLVQVKPTKFRSRIDQSSYGSVFGDNVGANLVQLALGSKYNFALGGLSAEIFYGTGQVSGNVADQTSPFNGETRTLSLDRYGLQSALVFDNLFADPYVAPYFNFQLFGFNYREAAPGIEISGTTAITSGYSVGALFLLDWLEPDAALLALNSGVENTYLDVALQQLNTSNSEVDPSLQTSFNFSAGLKFEF